MNLNGIPFEVPDRPTWKDKSGKEHLQASGHEFDRVVKDTAELSFYGLRSRVKIINRTGNMVRFDIEVTDRQ